MLVIKKCRVGFPILLALLWFCGCTPPGPRALLKGQRLIQQGKYEQAIESLQTATRLLPRNAQAYNHLGLALQGNRQFAPALGAYKKALALDHKLAAAHYNLGCLQLEQNDPLAASDELTSYTLLQPNAVEGWLRLGDAQLRAHKLDPAEKAFKTALALHPRHPEVFNGLGIIQLQRKRPQEALSYFNAALAQNPNYSPALLNAGVVSHQYLNNRPIALQKYRQYLALEPRPANWEAVSAIASRLDAELNPAPVHLAQVTPTPATPVKSNSSLVQTSSLPRFTSNHPAAVVANPPARTNPTPAVSPAPPAAVVARTNPPNANPVVVAIAKPPVPELPKPLPVVTNKPAPPTQVTPKPSDIEVTQVPEELVVKPPQDIFVVRPPISPAPKPPEKPTASQTNPPSAIVPQPEFRPDKRGILSRLNPFGGKPKSTPRETPAGPAPENPPSSPTIVGVQPTNLVIVAQPRPAPVVPRYTYLSPPKPSSGNRKEAERFFAEGIKAQQTGRHAQAVAAYQKATQSDPAYFEAYYNQGLAAYAMANWKESLSAYEHALAIKPDSVDARYNFALALQQSNFPLDATDELLEILNASPGETRADLLLANLYARQFNQPKLARQYYLKVLEGAPHHPKAAEIRYWLAANP